MITTSSDNGRRGVSSPFVDEGENARTKGGCDVVRLNQWINRGTFTCLRHIAALFHFASSAFMIECRGT